MMLKKFLRTALAALPLLAVAAPLGMVRVASAAITISPDTFTEPVTTPNCAPGHAPGKCTLRKAVQYANGQGGNGVIQLRAGTYKLSVPLGNSDATGDTGDLDVTSTTTIQGAGAGLTTITSANQVTWNDRILEADYGATLTLNDVRISGGHTRLSGIEGAPGGGMFSQGGGLTLNRVLVDGNKTSTTGDSTENGGGISALSANLVINNSTISNNTAGFNGGGVDFEFGTSVTINNSTFSGNTAGQDGGGLYNHGGASSGGTFSRLFFTGNSANGQLNGDAGGGAIYDTMNSGTTARFSDIVATANSAPNMSGGGVYEDSSPAVTDVTYTRMTLSTNTALVQGGGFYSGNATSTISDSTITNNRQHATKEHPGVADGGGVAIGESGTVNLNNDTITNNQGDGTGGGLYEASFDKFVVHNTLLVNNKSGNGTVSNCRYLNPQGNPGIITSAGHNLANDSTCNLTAAGDRQGSSFDPNLGPLADNGGPRDGNPALDSPTLTRALPSGSVAINTAENVNCPAVDQRGVSRPQQGTCDVGAFEFVLAIVASPSPTPALPRAGMPGTPAPGSSLVVALAVLAAAGVGLSLRARRA